MQRAAVEIVRAATRRDIRIAIVEGRICADRQHAVVRYRPIILRECSDPVVANAQRTDRDRGGAAVDRNATRATVYRQPEGAGRKAGAAADVQGAGARIADLGKAAISPVRWLGIHGETAAAEISVPFPAAPV